MINYVDMRCKEWAEEVRGGLPGYSVQLFDSVLAGAVRSAPDMSDDAWDMEYIIVKLPDPWRALVKTHYLHPGNTTERIQRMRMSREKYYTLLDQAHQAIARELSKAV